METTAGLKIFEGFGQTETTLCCATLYPWMQPRQGTMGLPAPGYDLRVLDDEGNETEPGVIGEICIELRRSISNRRVCLLDITRMQPRPREPGMTDFTIPVTPLTGMNWGLFGMWDEMTYIIKSSGYRIGPFEVESVLLEHPAVLEVAVTGVPDPVRGFNVKATLFFVPDLRLATNW